MAHQGELGPHSFDFEYWYEDGKFVIKVPEEIDLYSSPEMKSLMLAALRKGDITGMSVDLSKAKYLDSTTFGILVGMLKRLRGMEMDLTLRGLNDHNIRKLFEVQGLDRIFRYEDEEWTDEPDVMRAWAESHGARPVEVSRFEGGPRYLSFVFPGEENEEVVEELSWEEFAQRLSAGWVLNFQPKPPEGIEKPFYRFVQVERTASDDDEAKS